MGCMRIQPSLQAPVAASDGSALHLMGQAGLACSVLNCGDSSKRHLECAHEQVGLDTWRN